MSSAKHPTKRELLAPRYTTRFQCIGGDCEDSCCIGWGIAMDADHHRKMRRAMSQTRADREAFERGVKRERAGNGRFALLVLQPPDGRCSFLEEDRRCSVHRRFGEATIPDVCAVYPRRQMQVGQRHEISGSLSCPEMARLAVLAPDAMEIVDADAAAWKRGMVSHIARSDDDYARSLDDLRVAMAGIIERPEPLSARLATLVVLADAIAPWFGRGKPFAHAQLGDALAAFTSGETTSRLAKDFASSEVPLEIPMRVLVRAIAARVGIALGAFVPLLKHAVDAYGITADAKLADITAAYVAARARAEPLVGARLEEILEKYAMNHVFASWFTDSADLGVWVRGLGLRIALIRYLVFAHPAVAALTTAAGPGDATATIERAAVEVISKFSRAVEHAPGYLRLLEQELPEMMPGLEYALFLLRV